MKTIHFPILRMALVAAALVAAIRPGKAQVFPDSYINVDWQFNVPVSNDFADKSSGWGMNFEGGYFVTDNITVGAFISYHTNFASVGRETLHLSSTSAMTTNQKHAVFQLPFGATARYNWMKQSVVQPYVGLKLGAEYAQMSSYYYVVKHYEDSWGFYMSPEVGVSIFPRPDYRLGFHVALYYSYASNGSDLLVYSLNNLNNFGIRLGVSF